jgi:hypothetical protein
MAGQQWEYCQLCLYQGITARYGKYSYNLSIVYDGPNGKLEHNSLSEVGRPLTLNPFYRVVRPLGEAGWELVSIQHGTRGPVSTMDTIWGDIVVYFKRPSIPGRAADEPKLYLNSFGGISVV